MSLLKGRLMSYRHPLFAVVITLLASLGALLIYLNGPLGGHFNQFFLPAKMFGIPSDLRAHGIQEIFNDNVNCGWDGQFYFYIANDPLGLKDTSQHIDSDAYRYQRIGVPLLANIVSKLTLQSWVSPLTYYLTNLLVILLAVGVGAYFFQKRGINPYWILLWSLGMGTQITLQCGLPDGAADGFLIIALVSLFERHFWLYALSMTFAALSREIYAVIPAFICLGILIQILRQQGIRSLFSYGKIKNFIQEIIFHLIPIIVCIGWQIFIRVKFHVSPSSQALEILGLPLANTTKYFLFGIHGVHPLLAKGRQSYAEAMGLLLYLSLLLTSLFYSFKMIITSHKDKRIPLGLNLSFIFIIGMYLCFGKTVMMHHTGYFKAANVFLFVIPFIFCLKGKKPNIFLTIFLISVTVFFDILLWHRISGPAYTSATEVKYVTTQPACLQEYQAKIRPISIEIFPSHHFIKKMLGLGSSTIIVNTEIENTSKENFSPYQGKGAVNVSYQWLDKRTLKVVRDGIRTPLTQTLKPHEKVLVPVTVNFPTKKGEYILKLSLVQEGCSWFYQSNPESSFYLGYTVY